MTTQPEPGQQEPVAEQESSLLEQIDLTVSPKRDGILIGRLCEVGADGQPLVEWPGSEGVHGALSTVAITSDSVDRQVALTFLHGSARQPLILGLIQEPFAGAVARVDGERLVLEGRREVELRCGKASILLREDGKVIVKGTHLVSRSSGANKIKGASVAIN
jgi:hypothetical protein